MRRKLFFTYVVIILFLSLFLSFYFFHVSKNFYTEEYKEHMIKEVQMLSYILQEEYTNKGLSLQNFSNQYSQQYNYRITIIGEDGTVLADSSTNEEELENHKDREEIKMAFSGQIGISIRYSVSLKSYFMYAAYPAQLSHQMVILRLAVPLVRLNSIRNQVIVYSLTGIILATLFSFLIAYFFANRIIKPLNELTIAAQEIAHGNFSKEIRLSGGGQITALTKAFHQMSKQLNKTIDQLENENVKLESIVNSMINGVIALDNHGKILLINDMSYQLFHIKMNQIIGYDFYDVIRNENIYRLLDEVKKEKKHVMEEFPYKIGLEGEKILRVYANPIAKQGELEDMMGILLVFQDVTQIRKLEQLRSDFVSNVTHELKTPLTSIMGFADTLKAGAIKEEQAALHFIDIIDIEANRLYRLIQDILSLSEIETREEDINTQLYDISKILDRVYSMLDSAAQAKGLKIVFEVQEQLPLFLCNEDRISQMVLNLVDNAIKYTEQGEITLYCRKEYHHLKFVISDTGIGIPLQCQERIFERFYRVDKGRSRKAGGTGLGLSIVKHIVFLYDGTIQVNSKEGVGTAFTILLPYQKESE